jgi:hypothetical protein
VHRLVADALLSDGFVWTYQQKLELDSLECFEAIAPGGKILCIMSVQGLHEAVFAIAGALDDEGQSRYTCLAVLCGVVGVPVRPGGLE